MNVGLFTDTYFPQLSGVATSINILKKQLEKNGHQVYIFTTTDPKAVAEKNVFRYESIPFIFFKDRRIAVTTLVPIIKKVKELNIDIIHTQTEFSMGMLGVNTSKLLGIPIVHTYHTWYAKYLHYLWNGKLVTQEAVKVLSKFYCDQADRVIVPSETIRQVLSEYGVKKPIQILPTGVPIPDEVDEETVKRLRADLGLAPDDYVLLSVNRLAEEKNLLTLLEKMIQLSKEMPQAKLVLVGDGPQRAEIEQFIKDHKLSNKVLMTGFIAHNQTNYYYQMADLYVNLSLSETQGLTFIEAITNHLPLVAMNSDYLVSLEKISQFGRLLSSPDDFIQAVIEIEANRDFLAINIDILIDEVSDDTFYQRMIKIYEKEINYKANSGKKLMTITNKFYLQNNLTAFKHSIPFKFKDFKQLKDKFKP